MSDMRAAGAALAARGLAATVEDVAEAAGVSHRTVFRHFATTVTEFLWKARGGPAAPPPWLTDAVAVQLSGFTTQSLARGHDSRGEHGH